MVSFQNQLDELYDCIQYKDIKKAIILITENNLLCEPGMVIHY